MPHTNEAEAFKKLQQSFAAQFESVFPNRMAPKTIVVIPSLTLDREILDNVKGVNYYEERLLCMLMLLRMPHTHVVYVTSMPIDPVIIDYYLHLLPGITGYHARKRLHLLSCYDASTVSLTHKILLRPRLVEKIKDCVPYGHLAHITFFNVTEAERTLALLLQMPVYGCDPDLLTMGNKSNGRRIFRQCGVPLPAGYEDLSGFDDLVGALTELKEEFPALKKAVVKLNEGFSGDGNAVFSYSGSEGVYNLKQWIINHYEEKLQPVAVNLSVHEFLQKLSLMQGIAEAFIEGDIKTSPSVQCRINPLGKTEIISTHDQFLGGASGQVYLGAEFPACKAYAADIGEMGNRIALALRDAGVLGRFSIDFVSVKQAEGWHHYAIEINLRKGGTTHPYLMLQFLTGGSYNAGTGIYETAGGQPRYYFTTDNLEADAYKGITPPDLVDIAINHDLLYDGSSQQGVMFHLIGSLSQFGKTGVVCIGNTPGEARRYFEKTTLALKRECIQETASGLAVTGAGLLPVLTNE
jgi:PGM1 C-terminal domain